MFVEQQTGVRGLLEIYAGPQGCIPFLLPQCLNVRLPTEEIQMRHRADSSTLHALASGLFKFFRKTI